MSLFNKILEEGYLEYHTEPVTPNSLDPRVFYFPPEGGEPKLQPAIKTQILQDIDMINLAEGAGIMTRVWDYFIVGPILKENSSNKCDIIVKVQISTSNLSDPLKEKILNNIKAINNRLAPGTTHRLVYLPTIRKIDINEYAAVYHPYTDQWLKKPRFLGEAKHELDNLKRVIDKKRSKYGPRKGLKKLGTI